MPPSYDAAFGVDQPTINSLLQKLFATVYPKGFQHQFDLKEFDITSIAINITQAPTVQLLVRQRK